jgi:YD repeat-containing protein
VATFVRSATSESLLINGREVYGAEFVLDACHLKLEVARRRLKRDAGEFQQQQQFKYDDDGQLERVAGSSGEWRFKYDDDGHLVSSSASSTGEKDAFSYDEHGRFARVNESPMQYDDLGRVVRNQHGHSFAYNAANLLVQATTVDKAQISYRYDHLARLVARLDSRGNVTQYFYAFPGRPHLVSHVYRPQKGLLTSLVYDDGDRLIFVDAGSNRRHYVVCDQVGSPMVFVTPQGKIAREVSRTPFGKEVFDSGEDAEVPIGFAGGVVDEDVGLVHLQVRMLHFSFLPVLSAELETSQLASLITV